MSLVEEDGKVLETKKEQGVINCFGRGRSKGREEGSEKWKRGGVG